MKAKLLSVSASLWPSLLKKKFYVNAALTLGLLLILLINGFHEKYPDEFDNILGGWYILHGRLPFSGFFSHHGPFAYYVGALVVMFSGASFVNFRIIYSFLLLIYLLFTYLYIRKRVGNKLSQIYLTFIYLWGIAATFLWAHMLIADNVAGLFITPAVSLLLLLRLYKIPLIKNDYIFISILSFLALISSLTFLYVIGFLYLYVLYIYIRFGPINLYIERKNYQKVFYELLRIIIILGVPYIFFVLYLFLTRSFSEYIYDSIIYNQRYYIYNYPGATNAINPIRFAIIIAHTFYNNFFNVLIQVKNFNFGFPFDITLALVDTGLFIYLLLKGNIELAVFYLLMIIYSNARSNPLGTGDKDYQAAVYTFISLFSMSLIIHELYKGMQDTLSYNKKVIFTSLFILISLYSFFTVMFLIERFMDKAYSKYMGTAPLIYDRPEIAPIINSITTADDYIAILPLEFEDLLYVKGKNPSAYHILIPGMGKSKKIQDKLIAEYTKNKPKVIWIDTNFSILGYRTNNFAAFFIDFLNKNYINIADYGNTHTRYVSVIPGTTRINLETMLYMRKENSDEIISTLVSKNYIKAAK